LPRYFIRLSYCGTKYNGWQGQPHVGTSCVQPTIEKALHQFLRTEVAIMGCGRTDTGVHAMDYYAHFDHGGIPDIPHLVYRLNKILPNDIAIHDIISVHDDAHARFDAISRSYIYHLHTAKTPFSPNSFFYHYGAPDIVILNKAASILTEFTDFSTFCKLHTDVNTMNCKITESRWIKKGDAYEYHITSDRFLRGMIRLIVGMCLNVDRGKLTIEEVRSALLKKERTGHDWSVPAEGLFLHSIKYPYL